MTRELRERIESGEGRGRLRWVPAANLHVTLRFLGQAGDSQVGRVGADLARLAARLAPFRYRIGGFIALPGPARPRVLAAAIEPSAPLRELAQGVEAAAVAAGFPREQRAFRPHVTVARVRAQRPPRLPRELPAVAREATAGEVVVYRSDTGSAGPVYAPVQRHPLTGPGAFLDGDNA